MAITHYIYIFVVVVEIICEDKKRSFSYSDGAEVDDFEILENLMIRNNK